MNETTTTTQATTTNEPETWIDPESKAYPSGSLRHSRRRFRARCPDGKLRRGFCGVPDTMFSIPARMTVKRKTVSGFISRDGVTGEVSFHPNNWRKNARIFDA